MESIKWTPICGDRAHPHDRIGVEVLGDDVAALAEDDLAPRCGAHAPGQPSFHLRADEVGVDVSPAVEREHDPDVVDGATLVERDLRHLGAVAEKPEPVIPRALIVVAVLPLVAGLTGKKFYDQTAMDHGFHVAMLACAALAVAGGVLAWLTISSEVLESEPAPGGDLPTGVLHDFSCAVAGPPLRPGREAECHPIVADSAVG